MTKKFEKNAHHSTWIFKNYSSYLCNRTLGSLPYLFPFSAAKQSPTLTTRCQRQPRLFRQKRFIKKRKSKTQPGDKSAFNFNYIFLLFPYLLSFTPLHFTSCFSLIPLSLSFIIFCGSFYPSRNSRNSRYITFVGLVWTWFLPLFDKVGQDYITF
jgi:hypothetical protein